MRLRSNTPGGVVRTKLAVLMLASGLLTSCIPVLQQLDESLSGDSNNNLALLGLVGGLGFFGGTSFKHIFVTSYGYTGNLATGTQRYTWNGSAWVDDGSGAAEIRATGIAGADAKCNVDPARPTSGTYKAMIVDNYSADGGTTWNDLTVNRRACDSQNCATGGITENVDWVFQPDVTYYSNTGATIFTANASGIFYFSTGGTFTNPISTTNFEPWTGLGVLWDKDTGTCDRWEALGANNGVYGSAIAQDGSVIYSFYEGPAGCATVARPLYCVEQ